MIFIDMNYYHSIEIKIDLSIILFQNNLNIKYDNIYVKFIKFEISENNKNCDDDICYLTQLILNHFTY